jgi:4-hydroxybenzoate polyprenyltransferase
MSSRTPSIWLTLAQLIRLPAVFTAMSDIAMGSTVAWALGHRQPTAYLSAVLLLTIASSCVYLAGMVLNDVADAEVDRHERSGRPIPSGRISLRSALTIGVFLLALGIISSAFVRVEGSSSLLICSGLAVAVVAYDFSPFAWLRLLLMPTCRFLNVLLGLSTAELEFLSWDLRCYLAGVVAIYIFGITLFARNEAGQSNRQSLRLACFFMAAALGLALALPAFGSSWARYADRKQTSFVFPYLLILLAAAITLPASKALQRPNPQLVQATVRTALQGIIILDAALACGLAGGAGLLILILLIPNWYTGRWLSST